MPATITTTIAAVCMIGLGEYNVPIFIIVIINPLRQFLFQQPNFLTVHQSMTAVRQEG